MKDIDNMSPISGRKYGENGIVNTADLQKAAYQNQFGLNGVANIFDTSAATPEEGKTFIVLQVIADAVVDAIIEIGATGSITSNTTLNAGTILYGRFTSIKLKSGKVRAYQGVAE